MYAPHLYNLVKNFTQPREIIWPPAYNNFTEIGTIHSQSLLYRQNKYINIFREIYFTPSLTAFQVQCSRFLSITPFKTIKLQKLGVFWKIQEICSKMGTRIFKIVEEMSEIIEPKVGNPKNSVSRNWAILSHPWNLTFFEDEIFQHFSYLYGLKVPKWNCAHILLWN